VRAQSNLILIPEGTGICEKIIKLNRLETFNDSDGTEAGMPGHV